MLEFAEDSPDYLTPVYAAVQAGDYNEARRLLRLLDEPQRSRVRNTIAAMTGIYL